MMKYKCIDMDFFCEKEINGLKSDIKGSEIAINAEKENFKKELFEKYGKEMEIVFNGDKKKVPEKQKKKCFLKRLFSI